jgi:hypothetical protein
MIHLQERPMTRFNPNADPVFYQLNDVRNALLRLHKVLLDGERARYEKAHGTIASPQTFLQLAINDPAFNWLHRLSELVVQIDEATEDKETPLTPEKAKALLALTRALLTPAEEGEGFARRYYEAIQNDPNVGVMQGQLRKLLASST